MSLSDKITDCHLSWEKVVYAQDVKKSIKKINNYIKKECICYHCQKIIKVINNEVGDALATDNEVQN